jgi:hypothetical protein
VVAIHGEGIYEAGNPMPSNGTRAARGHRRNQHTGFALRRPLATVRGWRRGGGGVVDLGFQSRSPTGRTGEESEKGHLGQIA